MKSSEFNRTCADCADWHDIHDYCFQKGRNQWLMAILHVIWGANFRQIAKVLDVHPSTVGRRLKSSDGQRERQRLRSKYPVTMSDLPFFERMATIRKK